MSPDALSDTPTDAKSESHVSLIRNRLTCTPDDLINLKLLIPKGLAVHIKPRIHKSQTLLSHYQYKLFEPPLNLITMTETLSLEPF